MTTTLAAVRARARDVPPKLAISDGRRELTYRELLDDATSLARVLARERVRTLGIALDNGAAWIAADLATQIAAATAVPLPGFFSKEQIEHAVFDSGADALLLDVSALRSFDVEHARGRTIERLDGGLYLLRTGEAPQRRAPHAAKISYTSGTTGRPKGVALTQTSMDTVASSLWLATAELGLRRHLCVLPLATLLENVGGVYAPLQGGASVFAPSLAEIGFGGGAGLDVERFVACLHRYRPDSVILLPQMLQALVTALERGAPRPESLKFIAVGGARVAAQLLERAERARLPVYEGYGLTECSSVVALNTPAGRRAGSVGRVLPHACVRVDEAGHIHVAGPAVCGYVGDAAQPLEIATGDIGRLDGEGFLHVEGRSKNVFITSFGRNVSPEWVEAELAAMGPIRQAAVFGEARPWNTAVVVAADEALADESLQRAIDAANRRLPDYARVCEWVRAEQPFTPANGLATPNGRNRRAAIWRRYQAAIDARYHDTLSETA
jgi:long-subunit acyl-CoA synthetase (AMP-forming)